jgi:hypothetical protein
MYNSFLYVLFTVKSSDLLVHAVYDDPINYLCKRVIIKKIPNIKSRGGGGERESLGFKYIST